MKKQLNSGFTLIELLVVIAIIGILAGLVLVALGNARDKANNARIKSGMGQLRTLGEIYYDSNAASYAGFGGVAGCAETPSSATCVGDVEASISALLADMAAAGGTSFEALSTATGFCMEIEVNTIGDMDMLCTDNLGNTKMGSSIRCGYLGLSADCVAPI